MKKHEIFKTNPNLKEVHMTSDGQAFYNDNDAKMHAKSLEDKKVELVLNPDHIEVVAEEVEEIDQLVSAKMKLISDEGNGEENEEIKANADGTENVLTEESKESTSTSTEVQTASTEVEETSTEVEARITAEAPKTDLSRMNKTELLAFAELQGLTYVKEWTNKVMVEEFTKQLEAKK